jgi:hypothetical protein
MVLSKLSGLIGRAMRLGVDGGGEQHTDRAEREAGESEGQRGHVGLLGIDRRCIQSIGIASKSA